MAAVFIWWCGTNHVPFLAERNREAVATDPPTGALGLRVRNVYGRFWRPKLSPKWNCFLQRSCFCERISCVLTILGCEGRIWPSQVHRRKSSTITSSIKQKNHSTDIRKVSQMLQNKLGQLYEPFKCWTSNLRSRAGLPIVQSEQYSDLDFNGSRLSPFTLRGKILSRAVWQLLSAAFVYYPFRAGVSSETTYHFEVGMVLDESNGSFPWGAKEIEMVCKA